MNALLLLLLALQAPIEAPSIVEVDQGPRGLGLRSVALYQLEVSGLEPKIAEAVTLHLVTELRKREGLLVVDLDDLRAALNAEAERQALGCDEEDTNCLSEVSDALGVDELLIGSVVDVGDQRLFALRRVDRKQAESLKNANRSLVPARGEALLAAIGPLVEELYGDFPLREGEVAGVPPEVALRLNPPPIPGWATTSTFVAGGVAAVAAGAAGLVALWQLDESRAAVEGSVSEPVFAANATGPYDNAVVAGYLAQGLGVAAGALLLGGALMLPFTDLSPE